MQLLPSTLATLTANNKFVPAMLALDTETSGLFPDDGARVATVSVAWIAETTHLQEFFARFDNVTCRTETIKIDEVEAHIVSVAWPFDQGLNGTSKIEAHGQDALWPDAENLPEDEWVALLDWLHAIGDIRGKYLIMQNAKFDLTMMREGTRLWKGTDLQDYLMWDTQNVNHTLWPLMKHPDTGKPTTSLKPVCQVLFGQEFADESKKVREYLRAHKLPAGRWDLIPWDIIGTYADMDGRLTIMLCLRQHLEITQGNAGTWYTNPWEMIERKLEITKLLYRMEWRGLPYDEEASRDAATETRKRANELAKQLPFKPTLPAAKEYFFTDNLIAPQTRGLGLIPYSVTDTGQPQMTEEITRRMVGDRVPGAKQWADYQKVTNAASMWYEGYAEAMGPDGRLRTNFRQNGTRSHRFSVERVNLQAIPQDYRLEGFPILAGVPTPRNLIGQAVTQHMEGMKLWELDLAQAELRVAAWLAKENRMLEMIRAGQDLHSYTTKELFPEIDPDGPEWSKYRQIGKRGNFSLLFGAGGSTFAGMVSKETGVILNPSEADRIVEDWNALYPGFRVAIDRHMNVVANRQNKTRRGWLGLINGERRWFEEYEDAHKAFNQRVQANLAQFGIDWMLKSEKILTDAGYGDPGAGDGMLLTIHDSQVILVTDDEHGNETIARCAQAGRDLWNEWFPIIGDVDAKEWG